MAGDVEKESDGWSWTTAINAFRDIEVAKRNNPKIVQAVEHFQTPLPRNSDAPMIPGAQGAGVMAQNSTMMIGFGLLLLGGLAVFAMSKK